MLNKASGAKCDETHPVCLNCSTTDRDCFYSDRFVRLSNARSGRLAFDGIERSISRSSPERTRSNEISFPLLSPEQTGEDTVNMAHLDLFNHLVNGEWESLAISRRTFVPIAIQNADTAPYLMYEMLALSAQHLSLIVPAREDYYKNQAMRLQNRSITLFNAAIAREKITSDNCIPFFVFSSALGAHHFCNVIRNAEGEFGTFVSSLVNSINLYHGLRAVVGSQWHILSDDSALKPVLQAGKEALMGFLEDDNYQAKETESKRLTQILEDPLDPLDSASVEANQHAINIFDCLLNYHRENRADENNIRGIFGWPTLVKKEFKDQLTRLSPKALIILAHYAVLLHHQRQLWLLGDGGGILIRSISQNIDVYWLHWLQWPNREISRDTVIAENK